MTNKRQQSGRRPVGVWIISAFYLLLFAGWMLLSFAFISSSGFKVTLAQAAFTNVDDFFLLSIGVIGVTGAIFLFLLQRLAVVLFSLELALNLAWTMSQAMRTNWTEALGGSGLFGVPLGWLIPVAVILYTRSLAKKGVLS